MLELIWILIYITMFHDNYVLEIVLLKIIKKIHSTARSRLLNNALLILIVKVQSTRSNGALCVVSLLHIIKSTNPLKFFLFSSLVSKLHDIVMSVMEPDKKRDEKHCMEIVKRAISSNTVLQ